MGPISRNCTSLKNEGRLPSMEWPMNWPIQATTNITRLVSQSGQASVSSQRTTNNKATRQTAAPTPSDGDIVK